ncbi:hypothetical protein [Sunxiuqinia dokdonensis]|uniref:Site-spific DNA-methyltransferase (Cytosine-N4-spific) n=1 Tax=Sunxiuqinia dokdonensis TaxID=1409788 RepID=A0A0L8V6J7_9BACT|nr:hypothetical protein [Sunxiuqinia dokdonensis]KOH44105.1 site-spific DNA-methyltransferase (cytosine-N4-spific) [Sunxiuqinia dokdonensis]
MMSSGNLDFEILNCIKQIDQDQLNASRNCRADNVHRLFQYPAMMVPMSQEAVVGAIRRFLPSDALMMDPFMGSATSIIIAMKYGLNCFGQDINPLAVLLSKVKTKVFHLAKLNEGVSIFTKRIDEDSSNKVEVNFPNINKWFTVQTQIELSKIRRVIQSFEDLDLRQFFWIALAETVRITSNDRTSTYKLHQRPQLEIMNRRISPITEFRKIARRSLDDIIRFDAELTSKGYKKDNYYTNNVRICWGDTSQSIKTSLKYNLLVSSPPYGDNHTTVTYGQHAYLPLQWINLKDIDDDLDYNFLRTTQEIDRVSLGGRIEKEVINNKEQLFAKTKALKDFFESFPAEDQRKLSKTIAFVNDFEISLDRIIENLSLNAYLIWTIGNRHVAGREIRNDLILIELMESKGIKFISDVEREILYKRMPSRNNISKTMSKEKILIFRKPY